jgi:hypothetical protein
MRMAEGGAVDTAPGVSAAYRRAMQAGGQQTVDDYYANLRADAKAYLANPNAPTGAEAYNVLLQSGISTSDLINAGVDQAVLDKIFAVKMPIIPQSQFVTPTGMTSAYERSPDLAFESQRLTAQGQDGRAILDKQGRDYIANLQQGGIDAAERAQMLEYATERGYSFDDLMKAGVDPNVLFTRPQAAPPPPPFPDPISYTPPKVYQPLPTQPDIFAAGQPALDTAFRESSPRTAILDDKGRPTGQFDYSPAAKLRPATGSGFTFTPPSVTTRPRSLLSPREIQAYGGLTSASQRFAQNRQLLDNNLRRLAQSTPALKDLKTYNQLRNMMMSSYFAADPNTLSDPLLAFDPKTVEGQNLQRYLAGLPAPSTQKPDPIVVTDGMTGKDVEIDAPVYGGFLPFAKGGYAKKSDGSARDGLARFQEGGEVSGRRPLSPNDPLYITEDAPVNLDELRRRQLGDVAPAADAQLPLDELLRRQLEGIDNTPSAARTGPSQQSESRNMLQNIVAGAKQIPGTVFDYGRGIAQSENPLAQIRSDVGAMGGAMIEGAKQDPLGFALDMTPIIGEIRSGMDAKKYSDMANEADRAGDYELADSYRQISTMAAAGAVPFGGIGARGARRAAISDMDDVPPDSAKGMLDALTPEAGVDAPRTPGEDVDALTALDEPPAGSAAAMLDEVDAPQLVVPNPEARGHALPSLLLVEATGAEAINPVTQQFTLQNKAQNFENIDLVESQNPSALTSRDNWLRAEEQAFGGDYLPAPPETAIRYAQKPAKLAATLDKLSPDMKKSVDEGFSYVSSIKNLYNSKIAPPSMTGRLFVWGILSRGVGPAPQEGAFLDLLNNAGPFIDKAVKGQFKEADIDAWKQMVSRSLPEGSPGKSSTMNSNAAGNLLYQLGQSADGGPSPLNKLHEILSDPLRTGRDFRREFFKLTQSPGIDNKVVSFIALVAGKPDMLVMDRIQSRNLWDDGRYGGKNIYDGIDKGGLSSILGGPRGVMVTEMMEDGLSDSVQKAYAMVGRPEDASISRMHWETWLIGSSQPVSHSTLQAVRSGEAIGQSVTEGKRNTFSSGMTYRQAINGPIVEYPLSDGSIVRMTPTRQKEFEEFIKNPKNGIVPKSPKFFVSESKDKPWFEQAGVDRRKLDETARQFENANPDGSLRSGDARDIEGGSSVSGRRAQFLNNFRRDRLNVSAAESKLSGRVDGRNIGRETGPYEAGIGSGDEGDGLLTFTPDANALRQYQAAGLNLPAIREVQAQQSAAQYNAEMTAAMSGHKFGAQVEIKSPEELAQARLFRTDDGSGFAVKPDGDIVAVFAGKNAQGGSGYSMLQAAVAAGGRKLDAFDTYLPKIYETVGFRPVARLPWNDEYAPAGWNKETFAKYNNGEPDVVFFVHDPEYFGGAKDVPVVNEYDQAVALQDQALAQLSGRAQGFARGGSVKKTSSRRMLENLIGKKPEGQRVDATGLQRFANGGEARVGGSAPAVAGRTGRAAQLAAQRADEPQTESRAMLERLSDVARAANLAFYENVSKPAVGTAIDMTLGLGDLAQMGVRYLGNRMGMDAGEFKSVAQPVKESIGVEDYNPYTVGGIGASVLPFAAAGRTAQAAASAPTAARQLQGMFPNLGRESAAYAGSEAAAAAARELMPDSTTAELLASVAGGNIGAGSIGQPSSMGIIKERGGNWLAGSIEDDLAMLRNANQGLLSDTPAAKLAEMEARYTPEAMASLSPDLRSHVQSSLDSLRSRAYIDNWIDSKLGKYIRNEMATESDPIRLQADAFEGLQADRLAQKDAQIARAMQNMERARLDRGVTINEMTASQAQIRELQRERALIAAQTGLHADIALLGDDGLAANWARRESGYPMFGSGLSTMGKAWEDAADLSIRRDKAGDLLTEGESEWVTPEALARMQTDFINKNPWLSKIPPESNVYSPRQSGYPFGGLGLDHLIDELGNATAPNSDLPASLRIDPSNLNRMSVADVSKKVDEINAWRKVNRAEADAVKANNAATVPYRQYDTVPYQNKPNVQEFKWVQLARSQETPEANAALNDALEYEGSAMGHSVGGYRTRERGGSDTYGLGGWDAITNDRARIYSLRDESGKPFATIEMENEPPWISGEILNEIEPGIWNQIVADRGQYDASAWLQRNRPDILEKFNARPYLGINQIKGPGNGMPDADALPFIQDFIMSGKWSYVNDLQNTGLVTRDRQTGPTPRSLKSLSTREIDQIWDRIDGDYTTESEMLSKARELFPDKIPSDKKGFAKGGAVTKNNVERMRNDNRRYLG